MKRWLVIRNEQYYPDAGTGDWLGCYESKEEADIEAAEWEMSSSHNYAEVVDLWEWIGMKEPPQSLSASASADSL